MIGRALAHIGGAQEDILREAPGDRAKFSTLGGVLLGTAALAGASAFFAMQSMLKLDTWAAVAVGFLWALLILALDRQLITTLTRQNGWRRNLLSSIPRLLLAVLLGAVISEPIVLRIFEPEIQVQLGKQQGNELAQISTDVDGNELFLRIPQLQETVSRLSDVDRNPEVTKLTSELDERRRELDDLSRQVGCEVVAAGECGRRVLGEGPNYREFQRKLGIAQRRIAELEPQLQAATDAAQRDIAAQRADPNSELSRANEELVRLSTAKSDLQKQQQQAATANTGLSARLAALHQLGSDNAAVLAAHIALFMLFALIEILPVVAKLFSLAGPPTLYEQLVARREQEALDHGGEAVQHQRDIAAIRAETTLQLERDRAAAQLGAGQRTNQRLVGKQEEIAARAIDVWADVANTHSDRELRHWYEQQVSAGSPGTGYVGGSGPTRQTKRPEEPAMSWEEYERGHAGRNTPDPADQVPTPWPADRTGY